MRQWQPTQDKSVKCEPVDAIKRGKRPQGRLFAHGGKGKSRSEHIVKEAVGNVCEMPPRSSWTMPRRVRESKKSCEKDGCTCHQAKEGT